MNSTKQTFSIYVIVCTILSFTLAPAFAVPPHQPSFKDASHLFEAITAKIKQLRFDSPPDHCKQIIRASRYLETYRSTLKTLQELEKLQSEHGEFLRKHYCSQEENFLVNTKENLLLQLCHEIDSFFEATSNSNLPAWQIISSEFSKESKIITNAIRLQTHNYSKQNSYSLECSNDNSFIKDICTLTSIHTTIATYNNTEDCTPDYLFGSDASLLEAINSMTYTQLLYDIVSKLDSRNLDEDYMNHADSITTSAMTKIGDVWNAMTILDRLSQDTQDQTLLSAAQQAASILRKLCVRYNANIHKAAVNFNMSIKDVSVYPCEENGQTDTTRRKQ